MRDQPGIGLVLGSTVAPERLTALARSTETGGFDELWLAEDFFFTGGISSATAALAATERIRVGLGVVSAVVRHPALLAMEISTISRIFPGRLTAGIGLGVPVWIRQMGLYPPSALAALRESVTSIRRLLEGEMLTEQGDVFGFDEVRLTYPRSGAAVPIHMGVSGPKMLRLSGEIADGTVLSVAASTEYVRWARERIDEGRTVGGKTDPHRVTTFALFSVDEDGEVARRAVRERLAFYLSTGANALTDAGGISETLNAMLDEGGYPALLAEMPPSWVERMAIAGTPDECAAQIRSFYEAGSDAVALFPVPAEHGDRLSQMAAAEVLPRLVDG